MGDAYHLEELRIALDRAHPSNELPPSMPPGAAILDIGCGAGQTLIAAYQGQPNACFGLDIDLDALRLGHQLDSRIRFACGRAEALPFERQQFDLIIARVSLAYTDISRSLSEIRRVCRPGGQLWLTLHPFELCWRQARAANWKGRAFFCYIVLNGLCFHFFGRQFSIAGRQESFQTETGLRKALRRAGFTNIAVDRSRHFLVTARG